MKKIKIRHLTIASAIIWAAVILGCAIVLKGTPYKDDIFYILLTGAVFHLLFIWIPLGKQFRKLKRAIKVLKNS